MFLYHFYSPIYKCSDQITILVSRIWSVSFVILFVDLSSPPVFRRTISVLFYVFFESRLGFVRYLYALERTGTSNSSYVTIGNSKAFSPCTQTKPNPFNINNSYYNVYSYPFVVWTSTFIAGHPVDHQYNLHQVITQSIYMHI